MRTLRPVTPTLASSPSSSRVFGAAPRAAARPVRRAGRALTGAPGALLAPRLLVAAHDLGTALRGVRRLALVGQVRLHGLVHHRHVDRAVEGGRREAHAVTRGAV